MKNGEFRRSDRFHLAMSVISLIVFYFSAAPVLQLLGRADAYNPVNLQRRKTKCLISSATASLLTPIFPCHEKKQNFHSHPLARPGCGRHLLRHHAPTGRHRFDRHCHDG